MLTQNVTKERDWSPNDFKEKPIKIEIAADQKVAKVALLILGVTLVVLASSLLASVTVFLVTGAVAALITAAALTGTALLVSVVACAVVLSMKANRKNIETVLDDKKQTWAIKTYLFLRQKEEYVDFKKVPFQLYIEDDQGVWRRNETLITQTVKDLENQSNGADIELFNKLLRISHIEYNWLLGEAIKDHDRLAAERSRSGRCPPLPVLSINELLINSIKSR